MTTLGSIDQGGYNQLKPLVKTGGGFDCPTLACQATTLTMSLKGYVLVICIPPHWGVSGVRSSPALATCETSQVLLAGVSGGFPGVLPFHPPNNWLVSMSEIILKGTLN